MPAIKENLVTPDMVRKVLGCYFDVDDCDDDIYKGIANSLNRQIHARCPFCDEGMRGCQCWNDE